MNIKKLFSSRKFKYGTVAFVFTAIFCAFIILLNGVFTIVADHNGGFFFDLTNEKIYDLSQNTINVIKSIANDKSVEIIFCTTEDKVNDTQELAYIKRLADKYCSYNSAISVVYKDCNVYPKYFEKFGTVSPQSVIINCEYNNRFIVYDWYNFYKLDSKTGSIFAYDGENKLTSAIMQTVLNQKLKAGLVSNHGEYNMYSSLNGLLIEQGYDVIPVDISKSSREDLADFDLLIVCEPTKDFIGVEASKVSGVNEIDILNEYLMKDFGNLLVFISPDTPSLPEFSQYLSDTWGVSYLSGAVITEDSSVAISGNEGRIFYGTASSDGGYGSKIHNPITSQGIDRALFTIAMPLVIEQRSDVDVSAIYTCSSKAKCIYLDKIISAGKSPVMTISRFTRTTNGKEDNANVFVCSSSRFLNAVDMAGYANKDILKSIFAETGNKAVITGIDYKVADDTALDVSVDDFKHYTLMLSTVVPFLIAVLGIYVYIKRKIA